MLKGKNPMAMRRRQGRQQHGRAACAILCSVAFVGASNYCNVEAFAAHPAHSKGFHDAASSAHHDDESSSTPADHHEDALVACCAAMQAVTTPRGDFHRASSPAWQFQPLVLESSWFSSLLEPSRTASGVRPPAREPTPARPFYRTAFASHAPPAFLA